MGEATDLNPVVLGWVRIPRRPPLPITTSVVGKDCTIVLVAGGESLQGRSRCFRLSWHGKSASRAAGGDTHDREVTRAVSKTQYGRWVC